MLQALGARVTLVSASGRAHGQCHRSSTPTTACTTSTRRPDEILTEITFPIRRAGAATYWKLRRRGSFDFPVASAAVAVRLDGDGRVTDARIVLGAVASRPMASPKADALLVGQPLTDDVIAAAADAAYDVAKPMDNTDFELVWRKKMIRALVTSALCELRGDDQAGRRKFGYFDASMLV